MKTRTRSTQADTRLILWGLKQRDAEDRSRALTESAEPANRFFDYADTTLANLSNLVTGLIPVLHIGAIFIINALNSIPWISVILTTLNGLFRAVRSLVIKEIDPNKRYTFGIRGAYAKRIWFAVTGLAGVGLGLASMFVAALAIPLTIAATAVDTFNNIVKCADTIKRCIIPNPNQTRQEEVKRLFFKLESLVISATSLAGTILLFTPLMPLGAGLLIGSSIYALLDKYEVNPFKHLVSRIKNKIHPPVKTTVEIKTENTPRSTEANENEVRLKEERALLFEKLYCKQAQQPEPKKAAAHAAATYLHPTRSSRMKLFQEPTKRPDIETQHDIRSSKIR